MAELEDLGSRLAALEQANAQRQYDDSLQSFMTDYGSNFKNDRALGEAIMNNMLQNNISISPESVAEALEELRSNVSALSNILDITTNNMREKVDDALNQVAPSVDNAGVPPVIEEPPAPSPAEPQMQPETPPAEPPAPETTPAPEVPPAPAEMPPAPETTPAEVPPALPPEQQQMLSDRRLKFIKMVNQKVSDARMKNVQQPAAPKPVEGVSLGRFASLVGGE